MAKAQSEKTGKTYLKREEQLELLGADFVSAFDEARRAHRETWAKLSAMAAKVLQAPEGMALKLTPGKGDTLGVTFVAAAAGPDKVASHAPAAERLAALGLKVAAEPVLLGPDRKPKATDGSKPLAAPTAPPPPRKAKAQATA